MMPTYTAPALPSVFAPLPVGYPMGAVQFPQPVLGPVGPVFAAIDPRYAFPLAAHTAQINPIPIQFPVNPFAPEPTRLLPGPCATFQHLHLQTPALQPPAPPVLQPLYPMRAVTQPRFDNECFCA
jgi:hypothetical protein